MGYPAGKVLMAMDGLIVLGAVALNMTLAINHRPGRYMAI